VLAVTACAVTAIAGHHAACAQAGIVGPDAKWEELPRGGKVFGEGVVAAKDGKIYITDITAVPNPEENPGGTIYRYDPASGVIAKHLEPSGLANGLHVDKTGDLLIAQFAGPKGLRRVARQNLKTGEVKVVADAYQGKRLSGPNDLTTDAQGRIYFTDALYTAQDVMELPNAVYRLDPDGTLTQISTDILRPNGIEVSPDGRTLFIAACNAAALRTNPNGPASDKFGIKVGGIVAYDLADGKISNGRLIYQNEICVDGMTMDSDGNLYVAQHNGNRQAPKSEITVIDGAGKVLQQIPVPAGAKLVTNLGFGRGTDGGSLYLSAAAPWALFRIKTNKRGHYFE
jgi:gluconolactonase